MSGLLLLDQLAKDGAHKEISSLVSLIAALDDGPERRRALAKFAVIQARLDARGSGLGR